MLSRRLAAVTGGLGSFLYGVPEMGYYINVKDYGAVGNGSTDDTAAINAAIAATPAKGTLIFPAGDYKITSRITIDANPIRLLGAGTEYGGTTITQVTANTDALGFDLATSGYQEMASAVEHMSIIGPVGASATSGRGIYVKSDALLDNVFVYGFHYGAFFDSESYFSRAFGCKFRSQVDTCLYFNGGNNFSAYNCHFNSGAYGVYARGCLSFRIRDCVIEPCTTAGIVLDGTYVSPNANLMQAVIIDGCFFENNNASAPNIQIGPVAAVTDVLIAGNFFLNFGTANAWHIDLDRADRVTIMTNSLPGSGAGGGDIRCTANTTNVALVNQRYSTLSGMPASTVYLASVTP
jgi:hypothetical protein